MKGIAGKIKQKKASRPVDPEKAARREKLAAYGSRWSLVIDAVLCIIGYFLIEAMARHSFADAWSFADQRTKVFFYNAALIFLTTLPAYLIRRRSFYRVFVGTLWMALGAVNGIVLLNRVTPLTGPDFLMLSETWGVAGKYFSTTEIVLALIGIAVLVLALIRYFFVSPKYKGKMHRKFVLPAFVLACVGFAGLTNLMLNTKQLSSYFSNIAFAYLDYGFPYSLSVTIFDQGISQPNRYSEKLVQGVIREEGTIEESAVTEDMPNVIVVQLESYFDVSRLKWLKCSEDPLPNWHALTAEYSSGYYTVPTVGAGTVNTEFETLTGMSLRFFGAGEYPYKGILKEETCESAAYDLSMIGYTAHAIHDNVADFYGRRTVYANLGFNSFTSSEYMDTQDDVNENGWMRDENLISEIMDALDSTSNRDFVFTVSVQAHGSYPTEQVLTNPVIEVSGMGSTEANNEWEYYVNQIHEVDRFVGDLTEELSKRDEPVVVLFYGDHLPTLGVEDSDLRGGTTFDTDYLIWSNFDLERKVKKITAYQAMAEVFDRIGLHIGTMFNFHQTMRSKSDYFYNMQVLQYDILYGERYVYGETNPYSPTVLAMGVNPIRVDGIKVFDVVDSYYVYGQNFTQSCVFMVNGEKQETTYISSGRLMVTGEAPKKGDWVSVAVMNGTTPGEVLGTSNTFVYGVGNLSDLSASGEPMTDLIAEDTAITAPDSGAELIPAG